MTTETNNFELDMLFVKFKALKMPVQIPFIEVFQGHIEMVPYLEKGTITIVTKAEGCPEIVDTFSKEQFIKTLDEILRDPKDVNSADYGVVEDFVIQPGDGAAMTPGTAEFLDQYNTY